MKTFQVLDQNGDGMLSFEEMYSGFHLIKKGQVDKSKVKELFDEIDINSSGLVDFNGI